MSRIVGFYCGENTDDGYSGLCYYFYYGVAYSEKIMNPLPAFIIVPVLCAVIGGYGETISDIIVKGIYIVAPIGVMFIFATLFFGVILTAGTLKPYMNFFIRAAGRNPIKICVGLGLLTFWYIQVVVEQLLICCSFLL